MDRQEFNSIRPRSSHLWSFAELSLSLSLPLYVYSEFSGPRHYHSLLRFGWLLFELSRTVALLAWVNELSNYLQLSLSPLLWSTNGMDYLDVACSATTSALIEILLRICYQLKSPLAWIIRLLDYRWCNSSIEIIIQAPIYRYAAISKQFSMEFSFQLESHLTLFNIASKEISFFFNKIFIHRKREFLLEKDFLYSAH